MVDLILLAANAIGYLMMGTFTLAIAGFILALIFGNDRHG
jgi:hypothetical protein